MCGSHHPLHDHNKDDTRTLCWEKVLNFSLSTHTLATCSPSKQLAGEEKEEEVVEEEEEGERRGEGGESYQRLGRTR